MNSDIQRPMIGVTYSSQELDEFLHWRYMFNGVVAAGGTPVAIDCESPVPHISDLVSHLDGLILSGGGDVDPRRYGGDPADPTLRGVNIDRDESEAAAFFAARYASLPILAICRGAHLVNVTLGGTLFGDLARDHGGKTRHQLSEEALIEALHTADVVPHSTLALAVGESGPLGVNSQHHQGIRDLAPELIPSAFAADGLIEGFELPGGEVLAVQWHPEVLWGGEDHALQLLTSFVSSCNHSKTTALSQGASS